MRTILYKPIFVNPQAYYVFPQLAVIQPTDEQTEEYAQYTGYIRVYRTLEPADYVQFDHTRYIDFEGFGEEMIDIDQYTNRGAVKLGRWLLPAIGDWIVDEIRWYDHIPESVDDPDYIVDYDYFAINDGILDLYGFVVQHLYTEEGKTDKVRFAPIVDSIKISQLEDGVEILKQETGPNYIHIVLDIPGQGYQYEAKEVPLITIKVIDDTKTVIVDGEATEKYVEYSQSITHVYKVTSANYKPHTDSDEYKLRIEYEGVPIAAEGHYHNAADATLHFFLDQWLSVDNGNTWERFTGYVFDFSLVDTAEIVDISSWLNLVSITENSIEDGWVDYTVFNFEADLNAGEFRTGTAEISYSWTKPENENIHTCKYPGVDYLEFSQVFELSQYGGAMPNEIRNALLLWYDVERQGATNESMAENPVLIDQSGNGYDATCYNFNWSGLSGIGGYAIDLDSINWITDVGAQHTSTIVTIPVGYNSTSAVCYTRTIKDIPSFKVKISGLTDNNITTFRYFYIAENGYRTDFLLQDGINNIPYSHVTAVEQLDTWIGFGPILNTTNNPVTSEIIIEFLPLYPNALLADGIDDYALVTGLPLLTKENGYTVIAKRKLFYKENILQAFASTGAFILERQEVTNSLKNTYNFGSANTVTYPKEVTYQTSKSFNGTSLNVGDSAGTDRLKIFAHTNDYTSIALYSFLLFNRDLTEQEIKWVKENMLDYRIEDEIKDSMMVWYDIEKQGATNENMTDSPILIDLSGNGRNAICNNFAWSEDSGIGKWPFNLAKLDSWDEVGYGKYHITGDSDYYNAVYVNINHSIKFNLKISNKTGNTYSGLWVAIQTVSGLTNLISCYEDGTYTVEYEPENDTVFNVIMYAYRVGDNTTLSYDLEILPEYPNALVSDGVDDIAQTADFTLGKNWTLMFDADYISEDTITAGIVKNNRVYVYDAGKLNMFNIFINETNNYTAQIDKERNPYCISSNDKIYLKDGTIITTQSSQSSANIVSSTPLRTHGFNNNYAKIALRKLLLFDRVLTQQEVNWATVNLLGRTLYNAPEFNIDFSKVNNSVSSFTDLTGKHTVNLYNFAGSGMSGRDGYVMDMNNWVLNGVPAGITLSRTKTSIHIELTDEFASDYAVACMLTNWDLTKDRTFRINSTYSQGFQLSYYLGNVGDTAVDIPANGDVFVPANPDSDCKVLYFNLKGIRGAGTIDIELLPAYSGAYVFDGVDDYMKITDLNHGVRTLYMAVNPFKGSTVLYNQRTNSEGLNDDFAIYNELSSKIAYSARNSGDTYINGVLNTTLTSADLLNKKHLITIVNNADTIGQEIRNVDIGQHGLAFYANMACYKLIGFNEVHTEEQIQQVIKDYNLMEGIE